ncbi:MAG: gamma-glutamylcyclotransferase [Promethearchaeota archaeon]|nr:MAG: gamma-glutamylcyclotransferase [Candidatus Lokiarchaeota archaeon]
MSELISVVGYGTFITRGHWKDKKNVEVCKVIGYRRIFPKGNWFPYIIPSKGDSFWALKFDVNAQQLKHLDYYEGVQAGLYKRVKTKIQLKNGETSEAYVYVPTQQTIESQNLSLEIDKTDRWKEEIKQHPEVIQRFPELGS